VCAGSRLSSRWQARQPQYRQPGLPAPGAPGQRQYRSAVWAPGRRPAGPL